MGNYQGIRRRMVHVRLTEELHKKLRIRAAENDMTLQDWVALAIKKELDRYDQNTRDDEFVQGDNK